jgi:hypothetical protein
VYSLDQIYAEGELVIKHLETDKLPAGHSYYADINAGASSRPLALIDFQNGPIREVGTNGFTNEALLAILIHRTETVNKQFPCEENELAIKRMKEALEAFNQRTANRKARGVEDKMVV